MAWWGCQLGQTMWHELLWCSREHPWHLGLASLAGPERLRDIILEGEKLGLAWLRRGLGQGPKFQKV
jgi:hypothetical protein